MQYCGAALFVLERSLDGLDLTADAAHPIEQLHFLAFGVGHG
jgi:hypothetical protein